MLEEIQVSDEIGGSSIIFNEIGTLKVFMATNRLETTFTNYNTKSVHTFGIDSKESVKMYTKGIIPNENLIIQFGVKRYRISLLLDYGKIRMAELVRIDG